MSSQHFNELLLDVYRCSTEPNGWSKVLDKVCHLTGARSAVIQILKTDDTLTRSQWTLRDSESESRRSEHDRLLADPVNPRMKIRIPRRLAQARTIHRDDDLFVAGDPALKDLQARLAALHLGRFMSVGMPLDNDMRLVLVLHRDIDDPDDFSPQQQNYSLNLLPHLHQSIHCCLQLDATRQRNALLEQAMDSVQCSMLMCKPTGEVTWANQAGRQLLARNPHLKIKAGHLVATSANDNTELKALLARCTQTMNQPISSSSLLAWPMGKQDHGLGLHVVMVPVQTGNNASQALLIVTEPGATPHFSATVIAKLFGLTPAESRLATALCHGLTLREYAQQQGVTVGTARCQLKQVLAKMQASRQSALIQQICSSAIAHTSWHAG